MRWHISLAQALQANFNARVDVALVDVNEWPKSLDLLILLENLIHRIGNDGMSAKLSTKSVELAPHLNPLDAPPDVLIDTTGEYEGGGRVIRILYDGIAGEAALATVLLESGPPVVSIVDSESGNIVATGRPGVEDGRSLATAMDDVLVRTRDIVIASLRGFCRTGTATVKPHRRPTARLVTRRLIRTLPQLVAHRLYRMCCYAPHWRVGWRNVNDRDVLDLLEHPQSGWNILPDDGLRFYADPFPILHRGTPYVFVEEYEHRKGKGIISATKFGISGPMGTPQPVLERPYHLSYPFVFEHRGEMMMIPETCNADTIELYRATRFPGGWVHETTLLEGLVAGDATLHYDGERWWLFASVRGPAGSYSDALHLWYASDPLGPWIEHAANPVIVDVACARPAGRMALRDGRLIRPVQDCSVRYGGSLALAEVTELTPDRYSQRIIARLEPGPLWPGRRLHTLNRAGSLEVIDGSSLAPKWRPARYLIRN